MNFETSAEIEIAVAKWIGIRTHLVVPNVSWGLLPYEADLLVLSKSGYAWEIEIKVSRGDLLRDKKKWHKHNSRLVRLLYFAIPEKLESSIPDIPERAGIIVIDRNGRAEKVRDATPNKEAQKLSQLQQFKLARLGALRIWGLKEKLMASY